MENEKYTPEELRNAENQVKAMKFDLENDSHSFISSDMPPEMADEFFKMVLEREKALVKAEKISIYEIIGKPKFAPMDLLENEEEFAREVERLQGLCEDKGILITPPEAMKASGFYRFLIEDFFNHEIENIDEPGLIRPFYYEMFYQDSPEFIGINAQEFIEDLINLEKPYDGIHLSDECYTETDCITGKEATQKINAFREKYEKIIPIGFSPEEMTPKPYGMFFTFGIKWDGILKVSGKKEEFEGLGVCRMGIENRNWMVKGVFMPGFKF